MAEFIQIAAETINLGHCSADFRICMCIAAGNLANTRPVRESLCSAILLDAGA